MCRPSVPAFFKVIDCGALASLVEELMSSTVFILRRLLCVES